MTTLAIGLGSYKRTDVAAGGTSDLGAVSTWRVQLTGGGVSVSSFGTRPNCIRYVLIGADLTLVHSSTLRLPGGADIAAKANDNLIAFSNASGNWRVVNYQRDDGEPIAYASELQSIVDLTTASFGLGLLELANAAAVRSYVEAEQLGVRRSVGTISTTTYTFALGDEGKFLQASNASAITLTVPPNSSAAFSGGAWIDVVQQSTGQVTIAPGAGVTLRSPGSMLKTRVQYSTLTLIRRAADDWYVSGDLAP